MLTLLKKISWNVTTPVDLQYVSMSVFDTYHKSGKSVPKKKTSIKIGQALISGILRDKTMHDKIYVNQHYLLKSLDTASLN